jgi:hypothetical protein
MTELRQVDGVRWDVALVHEPGANVMVSETGSFTNLGRVVFIYFKFRTRKVQVMKLI